MSVTFILSEHLHEQRTNINIAFLRPRNTVHCGKDKAGKDHRDLLKNRDMKDNNEEGRDEAAVSVTQFCKSLSISIFVKLEHKRGYATRELSIALDISQ